MGQPPAGVVLGRHGGGGAAARREQGARRASSQVGWTTRDALGVTRDAAQQRATATAAAGARERQRSPGHLPHLWPDWEDRSREGVDRPALVGRLAWLSVRRGGELRWWDGERNRASSFDELLDQLANGQRNDEVQLTLHLSRRERGPNPTWDRDDQSQQDAVVSGYESFRVRARR